MKNIVSTLTIISMSLVLAGPVSAATISGNGVFSKNIITQKSITSSLLVQSNKSTFKNNVGVGSGTGGVNASQNTGGETTVTTGGATTDVSVENTANVNTATQVVDPCCPCSQETTDPTIIGNGAFSWNKLKIVNKCSTTTVQSNDAYIKNNIYVESSTGGVNASQNTGSGVDVTTGDSSTTVTVTNTANSNSAGSL